LLLAVFFSLVAFAIDLLPSSLGRGYWIDCLV
jgi:hypothetical protein